MASVKSVVCAAFVLLSLASAHFNLITPTSIGFSDDGEGVGPCGNFMPDFSNKSALVDFHVGGEPVAVKLGHTQANWLYRATLDQTASGNWTQLFPIVQQSGLGAFCEPAIPAPSGWVGKQGVFSIVANAPDGLLYQCAIVNFVSGIATVGSTCTNSTIQVAFVGDPQLSGLVSPSSSNTTATATGTASGTTTSSTSSPSSSKNAAPAVIPSSYALRTLIPAVAMGFLGFALL